MDNQRNLNENPADQSPEELTPEEELEISGYQPEQVALIDQEYLIQRDSEQAEPRDSSENPLVRGAIASLLVGGVMGFAWMMWSIFFAAKPIAKPTVVSQPTPKVFAEGDSEEKARLKAELALRNQASRTIDKPQNPIKSPTPATTRRPIRQARAVNPTPRPRVVRQEIPQPPRVIRERIPVQPQPRNLNPVEPVDPFERWDELATLGQQTVASNNITPINQPLVNQLLVEAQGLPNSEQTNISGVAKNTINRSFSNSFTEAVSSPAAVRNPGVNTQSPTVIPVVAVSNNTALPTAAQPNNSREQIQTPGEWGILNRTPPNLENPNYQETVTASVATPMQVQIGTTANASVLVPMIWADENKNQGRFAVELQQNVLSTDNRVALPKGTILITEVDSVSSANKLLKQSVVAIVYTDSLGEVRQQTIPKDAILIRGEDNQPLVAQSMSDRGAAIAQQDILIGLLGAASRAGEIFNQNQSQSSTVISNGGFNSQTVTTTAREPNVLAAAVEGFFKPMTQRLSKRADKTVAELESRPNVAVVSAGTKVSIFFNSFFEISR